MSAARADPELLARSLTGSAMGRSLRHLGMGCRSPEAHHAVQTVIAAISGRCLGGGFEITLSTDIRIGADTAALDRAHRLVGKSGTASRRSRRPSSASATSRRTGPSTAKPSTARKPSPHPTHAKASTPSGAPTGRRRRTARRSGSTGSDEGQVRHGLRIRPASPATTSRARSLGKTVPTHRAGRTGRLARRRRSRPARRHIGYLHESVNRRVRRGQLPQVVPTAIGPRR